MKKEIKEEFKNLKLIFWGAVCFVVIISGISILFKALYKHADYIEAGSLLLYLSPLAMIGAIILGYYLYKKEAEKGKTLDNEHDKFLLYIKAQQTKYGLFVIAGVISAVSIYMKYSSGNIYIPAIIILFFFLNMPTENRFRKDFLGEEEQLTNDDE